MIYLKPDNLIDYPLLIALNYEKITAGSLQRVVHEQLPAKGIIADGKYFEFTDPNSWIADLMITRGSLVHLYFRSAPIPKSVQSNNNSINSAPEKLLPRQNYVNPTHNTMLSFPPAFFHKYQPTVSGHLGWKPASADSNEEPSLVSPVSEKLVATKPRVALASHINCSICQNNVKENRYCQNCSEVFCRYKLLMQLNSCRDCISNHIRTNGVNTRCPICSVQISFTALKCSPIIMKIERGEDPIEVLKCQLCKNIVLDNRVCQTCHAAFC